MRDLKAQLFIRMLRQKIIFLREDTLYCVYVVPAKATSIQFRFFFC